MRVHARTGKLSVPMHVDNGRGGAAAIRIRLSAAVLGAALAMLWLFGPTPVRAANELTDAAVSPGSGTTATRFELSVTYTSNAPTLPTEVWAEISSGSPIDLVTSDAAPPATYRGSTQLPAGDVLITFRATVLGSQPAPVELQVTVTPEPTPTAGATPTPLPSATSPPGSTAPSAPPPSAAPSGSVVPTLAPTPVPPGVTPVPAPPAPPGVSAGVPTSSAPADAPASSPASTSQALPSPGKSGSLRAGAAADRSGPPDIVEASGESGPRGGLGQVTLVALGSATSVAGAAILVRQWRARRAARSAAGAGASALGPVRRYPPRR